SDKYFSAIEQFITGASRNRISRSNLSNITIPLPSLAVQESIVAEIESEQKAIDACKELIKIHENKINETIKSVWPDS
ncbi:MAG: restriction endonuclease subunit S, partial [Planctomycetaceae bacterium]|nr:restriction endonuclease subunit S [Planctomycetaceae bacterium]